MRTHLLLAAVALSACGAPGPDAIMESVAEAAPPTEVHSQVLLSEPYTIDKKYMSMTGPYGFNKTTLLPEGTPPELLWIVGYESHVVRAKDNERVSQEFMCHANLDVDPNAYFKAFPTAPSLSGRFFTLSQGQYSIDFPQGFGLPIPSNMELSLATQVLNLNRDKIQMDVRHEVTIRYVRDSELHRPMTAMYQAAVEGFKALEEARYYGVANHDADSGDFGPGCSVGQAAIAGDADEDGLGQKFTAHWVVEPGLEVNRTNVTRFLNLPFDTKAHYIAAHLHPFAETMTLKDLTTDTVVYEAKVEGSKSRIGIDRVDFYSSTEGIAFHKGHEYELTSRYNNTGAANADSMAVMYLYLVDPNFKKPTFESETSG
jgi:hypothetical protein